MLDKNTDRFFGNLSLLTDFYELTMCQAYWNDGMVDVEACFDLYFRNIPQNGGYVVMAGLQEAVECLQNLSFSADDIDYLRRQNKFSEDFLAYLSRMKFECDVWAVPEGQLVFPNEPIVKVCGPIIQAQLIETILLLSINYQSLIATKASRIKRAAGNRIVLEFGARRAQASAAAVLGARAAYIGGVDASSCTLAGRSFDVPVDGTMAHSYILAHDDEYTAFKFYCQTYPDKAGLLVDTYNTLLSGVPNAIKVAREVLHPIGKRLLSVRIDSGDLTYLSQKTRQMLDKAGMNDCKIIVSNSLDEFIIRDLLHQGAKVDVFGVGEQLITSRAEPVLGGVYKLAAVKKNYSWLPKLKMSENAGKISNPSSKKVYRFFDRDTNMAIADLIMKEEEKIPTGEPYEIFDPVHTWKRKEIVNYKIEPLLHRIFDKGHLVYNLPDLEAVKQNCQKSLASFWDSYKRFENPEHYIVDLSYQLWMEKQDLLFKHRSQSLDNM